MLVVSQHLIFMYINILVIIIIIIIIYGSRQTVQISCMEQREQNERVEERQKEIKSSRKEWLSGSPTHHQIHNILL